MSAEVVARWRGFVAKVETRCEETLDQAVPALLAGLEADPHDTQAFLVGWGGVKSQLGALIGKISEASYKLEEQMPDGDWLGEARHGDAAQARLTRTVSRRQAEMEGAAGEIVLAAALATVPAALPCDGCGAPVPVKCDPYRAGYVPCPYCERVATYEPSSLMREVTHFAAPNIAEARALPERVAWEEAGDALGDPRRTPPAAYEACERAEVAYHRKRLEAAAEIVPSLADRVEADMVRHERQARAWRRETGQEHAR